MQSVLIVRNTLKDVAEAEVADAQFRLNQELKELEKNSRLIDEQLSPVNVPPLGYVGYFLQREKYLKKLRDQRLRQQKNVGTAQKVLEKANHKLQLALIEVKKMEKASEKQKQRWLFELNSEEQKLNDEMGSIRTFYR